MLSDRNSHGGNDQSVGLALVSVFACLLSGGRVDRQEVDYIAEILKKNGPNLLRECSKQCRCKQFA